MINDYPIKPNYLDTTKEPKGFDDLLDYSQRIVLWAFIQFWQSRENWKRFTHEEFIAFISNPQSEVNQAVRCGIVWFVEARLQSLLDCKEDENKVLTYEPTHFVISEYFHWNPARWTYKATPDAPNQVSCKP